MNLKRRNIGLKGRNPIQVPSWKISSSLEALKIQQEVSRVAGRVMKMFQIAIMDPKQ